MRHLAEICEVYEPSAVPTPIYMKVVKMQVLAWKDFRFYINNRFPLQETLPATQSISHFYRQQLKVYHTFTVNLVNLLLLLILFTPTYY